MHTSRSSIIIYEWIEWIEWWGPLSAQRESLLGAANIYLKVIRQSNCNYVLFEEMRLEQSILFHSLE